MHHTVTRGCRVMTSLDVIACLVLLCSASVSGLQVPKPKPNPPRTRNVVLQAATPLWVSSAPADFAEAASELWEVLNDPRVAEAIRFSGTLPEEIGDNIFEHMKVEGWTSLKRVWEAEKDYPESDFLLELCGIGTPLGVQAALYASVKATFDVCCRRSAPCPPLSALPAMPRKPAKCVRSPSRPLSRQPAKTIYIDNERIWFANDEDFQLFLTRVRAAGVRKVPGVDVVEDVVCMHLNAISDGQFYTCHPPLRQSEY